MERTTGYTFCPMISPVALFEQFEREARSRPRRPILRRCGEGSGLSALRLLGQAVRLSRGMRRAGLGPGGIALLDRLEGESFIAAMLGAWARDGAILAIERGAPASETSRLRDLFSPRVIVSANGRGRTVVSRCPAGAPSRLPGGCAIVKLTSGSTGGPRGIATTAGQIEADARRLMRAMRLGADDQRVAAISLSHSYGLSVLVMPLILTGSPLLLVPSPYPDLLRAALSTGRPTVFPGVPYLFEMLLRSPGRPLPAPTRCISAGAPLRSWTAAEFVRRHDIPIRVLYGTSESGGIAYDASPSGEAALSAGCVGTPLPGVHVVVEGSPRRIVVSSRSVASGYVGPDPGSRGVAEGSFDGRRFLTGDAGRIDRRGRLHLTGRLGTLVNVSGRKVNPREIETTLTSLEGIEAAAVLAEPDAARGHALVACLVAERTITRERVMMHLQRRLAPFKLPRRLVFLDRLPINPRGKLDEAELRREVLGSMSGDTLLG